MRLPPPPTSAAPAAPARATSLPELLARAQKKRRRRQLTWGTFALVVVLGALAAGWTMRPKPVALNARFRTQAVTHGNLVREVRATGHVEAVSTVSVGAEISGRVSEVYADFNQRVKTGEVLARFDRAALEAQRAQTTAMAAAARAQLAQAKSDLAQAQRNRARADELFARGAQTQAENEVANTAVALSKARLEAAEASLAAQEAAATLSRTNLEHSVIRSPIDGIVITRNIDPGQTVASLMQTPILFTVAADLRKMEVVAAVDEADIGEVAVGQRATFTVSAYPERVFEGRVTEVRNAARILQDVVTYGAVVSVDNLDLALRPGMTASVKIRTGEVADVDQVPTAALHFTPPGATPGASETGARVWVLEGDQLASRPVHAGLSDGELTAIGAGELDRSAKVLVDLTPEGRKAYGIGNAR